MAKGTKEKKENRNRRHLRIRSKVKGTAARPRLSVFKSNKFVYTQIIDDESGTTLASATSKGKKSGAGLSAAKEVGKEIAALAKSKKVSKVVFDRGGYIYTGKIKAVAEGAREGGLQM